MGTERNRTYGIAVVAAGLLAAVMCVPAQAASSGSDKQKVELASTGVDTDASGQARFRVRRMTNGRLDVRARDLEPNTVYEIVVDGVHVGDLITKSNGKGRVRFRSRPRSKRDVLLGFDPRGKILIVRDAGGGDVLSGALSASSSSSDDGDVICCVPDDRGAECEDRTPEECAAEGGTVSAATSCLPDPCADTPPPADDDVVCCIPDDSGAECEDRTVAECSAEGGVVVEADSCATNPCAAVPPEDPDIRCCLPDNSGTECEDRTPAECQALGGVDLGPGSCVPNPCDGVLPPPGGGAAAVARVRCERRASRSKASVDGNDLAQGMYQARIVSGANEALSGFASTVGDEVEFDFDSNPNDIAAGATAIAPDFIQGDPPTLLGQLLDTDGNVVAENTVTCIEK